jgi:hypothetical protein
VSYESSFAGVSCPTTNWCMIVGTSNTLKGIYKGLVEEYDRGTLRLMSDALSGTAQGSTRSS